MALRRVWRTAMRYALPSRIPTLRHTQLQQPAYAPPTSAFHDFCARHFAKSSKRRDDEDDDDSFVDPKSRPDAQTGPRLNRAITSRFIRLVTPEGHKVVTREEALDTARKQELDLVEVDSKSDPIVCKIMDYKLERYKEKRREKERKKSTVDSRRLNDVRELQMSNKIDDRDMEMKADQASKLIQKGHRLKCVIKVLVKGSKADDQAKTNKEYKTDPRASKLISKFIELLQDVAKVESGPLVERYRVWAMLRPLSAAPSSKQQSSKKPGDPEDTGPSSKQKSSKKAGDKAPDDAGKRPKSVEDEETKPG